MPPLRPPAATPDFTVKLFLRGLAILGLLALAAITWTESGATRMLATPWTGVRAVALAVPALLLLAGLGLTRRPFHLPPLRALMLVFALVLAIVASALVSPHRGPSLLHAATSLSALALFLVVYDWLSAQPERNRERLCRGLAFAGAGTIIVSFLLWARDAFGHAELFSPAFFQRRNPHPLGHANYTAGLMLLALPWTAWAAWRNRGMLRAIAVGATLLGLFNLFICGSRGGLLGLAALGLVSVALRGGTRRQLLLTGSALLAGTLFLAFANPRIRDFLRPSHPTAEPNPSTVQREAMTAAAVLMVRDRPLLGWGPGTTPLVYPLYRAQLAGGAENVLQLHSLPLAVAAETGLVTASIAALALLAALRRVRRAPVAGAALAGYSVFALTDAQLDVPAFAAGVAVLFALLIPPRVTPALPRTRSALLLTLVGIAGVVLIVGKRDPAPSLNVQALELAQAADGRARAATLLRQSLELNPAQEIAHFNLGWLLVVDDPVTAADHFSQAAQLVPDKGGVYFGLGLARLNDGRVDSAARAFALECLNDPSFLASPWWSVPAVAAQREATVRHFVALLEQVRPALPAGSWAALQRERLVVLAPRLGHVASGTEKNYRRDRIGYPVLMRDSDLAIPTDLYDVRENPNFAASLDFPLPRKGWLPSPLLLKLLHSESDSLR